MANMRTNVISGYFLEFATRRGDGFHCAPQLLSDHSKLVTARFEMEALLQKLRQRTSARVEGYERQVQDDLKAYVDSGAVDWKAYCYFTPHHYTRNLVDICKEYEAIILCWEANQISPIHNHSVRSFPNLLPPHSAIL